MRYDNIWRNYMIKPHGSDKLNPLFVYDSAENEALQKEADNLASITVSSASAANAVMMGAGYFNPLTGATETSTGTTNVRFSDNREDVEKSVNASVKKAYELTLNAMAQDRAIALADEGKVRDAVKLLNRSAKRLREAGKRYGAPPLLERATLAP